MSERTFPPARWVGYYDAVAGQPARKTLVHAADAFAAERFVGSAVDLGCGSGRDTFELLRRGWRVLAIDADEDGIRRIHEAAHEDPRLTTRVSRLEDATWEPADLVNASYSLFFLAPDAFASTWALIRASLRPGARFSGQILGDRDTWAADPRMSHHTRDDAMRLLDGLAVELFEEDENPCGPMATGGMKHWHVFHVVARRPRQPEVGQSVARSAV